MTVAQYAGGDGPWAVDDVGVSLGGILGVALNRLMPTVDGIQRENPNLNRRPGGMVVGHDDHLTHRRDSHRSKP